MGVFHEMAAVVNRAPVPLNVRFDGQETAIPPGESHIPRIAVNHAKNQNPVMGSQDADNPNITGARYLIGLVGTTDDCTPLTKEEWAAHLGKPCRINIEEFMEDRLGPKERMEIKGKGRKTQARSSFDQGVRSRAPEQIAEAQ